MLFRSAADGGDLGVIHVELDLERVLEIVELGAAGQLDAASGQRAHRLELPGTVQLDDLEDTLEVEFDVDKSEITTIAGYLMAKLGRVPLSGDVWTFDEYRIVVVKTEGPRVLTVRIEPKNSPAPSPSPPGPLRA